MQSTRRVVVTGLGAFTPIGNTTAAYWQALIQCVSGAGLITRFDATKHKTKFACELKNYQAEDYFDRKEIKKLDPCSQYALIAGEEAVQDAALKLNKLNPERIGVIWGTGIGGFQSIQEEIEAFIEGGRIPRFNPFFIPKMIANMPAGQLSIKYGFKGPNYVTVSACASSAHALIDAVRSIQLYDVDIILTGGSEASITPIALGGFNAMRVLSEHNEDPQTASRPFDKDRDGFVLGEGAGALVLEAYEHAQARDAKIYAEVIGFGMSADAYHITVPHPHGEGAAFVMRRSLQKAGIQPKAVDYINVHGTSTSIGDINEIKAIEHVFGEHTYQLNISSTKSMTGHLLGAAGAIESVATIMALQNQIIPPTINHFTDDDAFDSRINFTFNQPQQRAINIALNNNFGFGGHNTAVAFQRWAY